LLTTTDGTNDRRIIRNYMVHSKWDDNYKD
jgi:hypothetical protein